jgi:hypothetical protein
MRNQPGKENTMIHNVPRHSSTFVHNVKTIRIVPTCDNGLRIVLEAQDNGLDTTITVFGPDVDYGLDIPAPNLIVEKIKQQQAA